MNLIRSVLVACTLFGALLSSGCLVVALTLDGAINSIGSGSRAPAIVEIDAVNYGKDGVIILMLTGREPRAREQCMKYPNGRTDCKSPIDQDRKRRDYVAMLELSIPMADDYTKRHSLLTWDKAENRGYTEDEASAEVGRQSFPPEMPFEIVWQEVALEDCETDERADEPSPLSEYKKWDRESTDEELLQKQKRGNERSMQRIRDLGYEPRDHVRKERCRWKRKPDRIHRQVLDLKAIADSPEFQRAGMPIPDEVRGFTGTHYTVFVLLVFFDDHYVVKVSNSSTDLRRGFTG